MSIKSLREMTGMPVGMCASAWKESGENMDKAIEILKTKGVAKVLKLQDRKASAGFCGMYRHFDGRTMAGVALSCETDFVGMTPEFKDLANEIAMHLAANPDTKVKEDLLKEEMVTRPSETVESAITALSAKTGEKIEVFDFWTCKIA